MVTTHDRFLQGRPTISASETWNYIGIRAPYRVRVLAVLVQAITGTIIDRPLFLAAGPTNNGVLRPLTETVVSTSINTVTAKGVGAIVEKNELFYLYAGANATTASCYVWLTVERVKDVDENYEA